MKKSNLNYKIFTLVLAMIAVLAWTTVQAQGVKLTPVDVSRLYAHADGQQSDGTGGYLGVGIYGEAEWNVLTDPLDSPSAFADDDPIEPPTDGWTLSGLSSFAIARSDLTDPGGWSTSDNSDAFELFINNQATGDPGGVPEGWGYSVSYLLITYDTSPITGGAIGDQMTVTLSVDLSGTLYAAGTYDEYLLDLGYGLGTGLTDYNPVLDDVANQPNPGLGQFDDYQSWRSNLSFEEPTLANTLEYEGVIGDQVQVLIAMSSFSYSYWGYTWTDGTVNANITATSEAPLPKNRKQDVLVYLSSLLPTGNNETDKRIEKAIKHIDKSLADKFWEDDSHLTKKGKKVFKEEKKAVHKLMKIVKDGSPLAGDVQTVIDNLVIVDATLAQIAIDDAVTAGGKTKEIDKAQKEMVKASDEISKGKFDKAIEHYKKAWQHAQKAVKDLPKTGAEGVSEVANTVVPNNFALEQNYPNPFNPSTTVQFAVPEQSFVKLEVYNSLGERITTLVAETLAAGIYSVNWNAADLPSGVYIYSIQSRDFFASKKMIIMK